MIVVIDLGIGNAKAVANMVKKTGRNAILTDDPETVKKATVVIFPGVGKFDAVVEALKRSSLHETLEKKVLVDRTPYFGICVGMQILFAGSEEGTSEGFGWVRGSVKKFDFSNMVNEKRKVPHIGWDSVKSSAEDKRSLLSLDDRFYFVHSYHAVCEDSADIYGTTDYAYEFCSAVSHENIFGVQFHPEKSHKFGLKLFDNFFGSVNV